MFAVQYNRGKERQQFKYQLEEHMDMLSGTIKTYEILFIMPRIELKITEIEKALGRIKKGKQPGPDRLKGKIYRSIKESEKLVLYLTQAYNAVLNEETVPEGWKGSKTVMIPKTVKPIAKEHRPIALTNVGYKIFMRLVKDKLLEHLTRNGLISDYQAGFTGGRRLEENLFVVRCCIEETYRLGKRLVVVAIDFEKAFDSVDRVALIRSLMYYKCDPTLIDEILDLYVGDRTEIWWGGILVGDVKVTGGIRQGCTG